MLYLLSTYRRLGIVVACCHSANYCFGVCRRQVCGAVPASDPDVGEDALDHLGGAGDLAGGAAEVDLPGGHLPVARHPITTARGVAQV